ncbi:MAG: ferrochelatase [Longimicrobiales bacterium]
MSVGHAGGNALSRTAVLLLNFGEPESATQEEVVPFLERIFLTNAALEDGTDRDDARRRSRQLAEQRAPTLIEAYRAIGGSPLNRQAREQAWALEAELRRRRVAVRVDVAMQFTAPLIGTVVRELCASGIRRLVALPVYPLCGPSTTVAALAELEREAAAMHAELQILEISGWHRHPDYTRLRAEAIRRAGKAHGFDLGSGRTRLVFSAHGTPRQYIDAGSRYTLYVHDHCRAVAAELGVPDFTLGYQNHRNRPIAWTHPDIEVAIRDLGESARLSRITESGGWRGTGKDAAADAVLVDAASFVHEQSETLAELDHDLRERTEAVGLRFGRVPIVHDDPRLIAVLADTVEARLAADGRACGLELRPCRCRAAAHCLNAEVT